MSKRMATAAAALVAAAFAQFLTLLIAGAGHGWVEPVWFSAVMWITLPLMAARVVQHLDGARVSAKFDVLVLLAGVILDALLVVVTIKTDSPLFGMFGSGRKIVLRETLEAPDVVLPWLAMWLSWQFAALWLLFSRRSHLSASQ